VEKRTQRVQWMHRVITVFTRGPRFLSATDRFISVNLPRSLPKCMDCREPALNRLKLPAKVNYTSRDINRANSDRLLENHISALKSLA